jgi:hypothetical protein
VAPGARFHEGDRVASPNYQGEKRRKDLAKQAKKKEKLARKLEKKSSSQSASGDAPAPEKF